MSEFTHSMVLFIGDDGFPLEFNVRNTIEKTRLKALIEHGNGLCTQNDNAVHLISPGTKALNVDLGKKLVSSSYIYDCVKQNRLLDVNEYVFTISEAQTSDISDEDSGKLLAQRHSTCKSPQKHPISSMNMDISPIKKLSVENETGSTTPSNLSLPSSISAVPQITNSSSTQSESFVEGSPDASASFKKTSHVYYGNVNNVPSAYSLIKVGDNQDNLCNSQSLVSPKRYVSNCVNSPSKIVCQDNIPVLTNSLHLSNPQNTSFSTESSVNSSPVKKQTVNFVSLIKKLAADDSSPMKDHTAINVSPLKKQQSISPIKRHSANDLSPIKKKVLLSPNQNQTGLITSPRKLLVNNTDTESECLELSSIESPWKKQLPISPIKRQAAADISPITKKALLSTNENHTGLITSPRKLLVNNTDDQCESLELSANVSPWKKRLPVSPITKQIADNILPLKKKTLTPISNQAALVTSPQKLPVMKGSVDGCESMEISEQNETADLPANDLSYDQELEDSNGNEMESHKSVDTGYEHEKNTHLDIIRTHENKILHLVSPVKTANLQNCNNPSIRAETVSNVSQTETVVTSSQPEQEFDNFDNMLLSKAVNKSHEEEESLSQSYTVSSSADAQVSPKPCSAEGISSPLEARNDEALPDSPNLSFCQVNEELYIQHLEEEVQEILNKTSPKSLHDKKVLIKYVCLVRKLTPRTVLESLLTKSHSLDL